MVKCGVKYGPPIGRWGGGVLLALLLNALADTALAGEQARVAACLAKAAQRHAVALPLLQAIAQVESGGNPRALNRSNRNGSRDIGLMQINSSWLPRLARWKISEEDLYDPCVSAQVGAWILADNIARLGPVWRAVGAYNARSPQRQWQYVQRVRAQLSRQAAHAGAPLPAPLVPSGRPP